jgi:hypothetical protein
MFRDKVEYRKENCAQDIWSVLKNKCQRGLVILTEPKPCSSLLKIAASKSGALKWPTIGYLHARCNFQVRPGISKEILSTSASLAGFLKQISLVGVVVGIC